MTDLKKKLNHLPKNKRKELEIITQKIIKTQLAEIIILFGSYARGVEYIILVCCVCILKGKYLRRKKTYIKAD